jgi:piezo-type mechanosensitive ion channel component 1/2
MYITIIFVLSRFIRSHVVNFSTVNIIVEELPNVDKILSLIQNIYVVREAGEFLLEEDLVAKLYFLYRSPETLIRYTKPHEN